MGPTCVLHVSIPQILFITFNNFYVPQITPSCFQYSFSTELTIRPLKDKITCFCVFFMSFDTHSQTYCFRIFLPIFPPPPSATLVNGCLSLFAWTQPNTQKPNRLSISLLISPIWVCGSGFNLENEVGEVADAGDGPDGWARKEVGTHLQRR